MTEKELIAQIRKLRPIQPRKDWVILTKSQIFGMTEVRPQSFLSLFLKPAFASLIAVFIMFGVFSFAQNSLPGDILYSFKRVIEKGQAVFVSEDEKPEYGLEMANKRLEELNKIFQNNQVGNLAPALKEFKATKVVAKKKVLSAIKNKSNAQAIKAAKEIAPKLLGVNEKEKEIYATLNIESTNEENNETAEKALAEILINDAKNSTLTEEQARHLAEAEEYYNKGEYQEALIKILESSPK